MSYGAFFLRSTLAPCITRWQPLVRVALSLPLLVVVSCKGAEAPTSSKPMGASQSSGSSHAASAAGQINTRLLTKLFKTLRADDRVFPPEIEALLSGEPGMVKEDPNWPTLSYLLGEAHRQRGESEKARGAFRELASWAVSNSPYGPYNDTWGGSGLAVIGLCRWLQILEEYGPSSPEEVDQVLTVASKLQETRLYSGMVQTGLLPAMPRLEEDVAKRLAHVAWKHQRPEATSLFLDFLTIDSHGEPDKIDEQIKDKLLTGGLVDSNRLALFRAMRWLSLVKTRQQKEQERGLARAAWPIDDSTAPSQSLMYAVMRHESRFYPGAISKVGAVGLFQIMPEVFNSLDKNKKPPWNLLQASGARSYLEYLLDPERSIQLWARWVVNEFHLKHRDGVAMTLMKHQAGTANLNSWGGYWKKLGAEEDLEYRIETARFNATRNFVRLALQDTAIVDAAKFFKAQAGR